METFDSSCYFYEVCILWPFQSETIQNKLLMWLISSVWEIGFKRQMHAHTNNKLLFANIQCFSVDYVIEIISSLSWICKLQWIGNAISMISLLSANCNSKRDFNDFSKLSEAES